MARAVFEDGSAVSGEPQAVAGAVEIHRTMREEEQAWVAELRAAGVGAAHPDDGWVDRDRDRVHLAYPQFRDRVEVGSLLALGWPDRHRLVRVVGFDRNPFGLEEADHWHVRFESVSR